MASTMGIGQTDLLLHVSCPWGRGVTSETGKKNLLSYVGCPHFQRGPYRSGWSSNNKHCQESVCHATPHTETSLLTEWWKDWMTKKRELVVNYMGARRAGKKWEEQKVTCDGIWCSWCHGTLARDCPDTEIKRLIRKGRLRVVLFSTTVDLWAAKSDL